MEAAEALTADLQLDEVCIGTYQTTNGTRRPVRPHVIRALLKAGAVYTGLTKKGFELDRVGTHGLRSGGATRLKLAGYDHLTIQKIGRWSSDTFLIYIQSEISGLSKGIAADMAKPMTFRVM